MTIAELEKSLKTQLEAFKLQLEATKTLEQLAKDAVAASDQRDLDAAIEGSQRASKLPTQAAISSSFNQGIAELQKLVNEIAGIDKQIADIKTRIQKMQIQGKTDFNALARALKIPKEADKLEKAMKLQGGARKKALETLQTDTGVKFSSKDMDSLMKAK